SQVLSRVVGAPSARLGGGGGTVNGLTLGSQPTPLSAHFHSTKEGSVVLDLSTTLLDLRISNNSLIRVNPGSDRQVRENFKRLFASADRDNNGYLDENEVRSARSFQALFKHMDLDGDGKLTEKEMLAYLDQMQELRAKATACCASLYVLDQGRGLFDLLDTNGDG